MYEPRAGANPRKVGMKMAHFATRLLAASIAAVAVLGTVAGTAHAQQPPAAPGGMQDPLGLTADQKKKMDAIQKKYQPQIEALQKKWQPKFVAVQKKYQSEGDKLSKDQTPGGQKKMQAFMQKVQAEMKPLMDAAQKETKPLQDKVVKEINGVLTPKQQATLKQLMSMQQQMGGPGGPGPR